MPFSKTDFIEEFIDETREHIDAINNGIILLKKSPKSKERLSALLRELHTIKGTARMMGFPAIEQLSHGLEDVLKGLHDEKFELSDNLMQLTFATTDCIKKVLKNISDEKDDRIDVSRFRNVLKKAAAGIFFSPEELNIDDEAGNKGKNTLEEESLENISSVRIDIAKINDIIRSFDNLIIRQFRFKHQLEEFESRLTSNEGHGLRELPKQLKEDMLQTETAIFDTQHQLLNLRMLPLNIILSPLRREVETDSKKLSKKIDFNIPDTDFVLDKTVLENVQVILMHLVRNCIDHGIENPDERKSKGKKEKGLVSVCAREISNSIIITVSDDGRGIQFDKIREKAIQIHPKEKDAIAKMSEKELEQFIFESGFSTLDSPTELSGRGLGLDIVRTNMEKIKGRIRINTEKDSGTSFELTVPLSLATQQGLFVHCGNMKLMIPSHYIVEIMNAEPKDFTMLQNQTYVSIHNQLIPVYSLSSLIGGEHRSDITPIIVVEYLNIQLGIMVESIEQYENVVVNPLPPLLKKMEALQGVVYDENYSIIPILNTPDIMRRLKGQIAYDIKKYKSRNKEKIRRILVVEDSVTTRQIEQMIFEADGYSVETAADGIEALDKMRKGHIDAVITDIKMPRMDGLVFLSNIRRMEEYENIPVIVVSGVYDETARDSFIEAGAQEFIVKSDFQRGNLLETVKEFLGE
ncbi:MAG: response regulator [Treponema sp.]|nr:response regulator [Treponema sp.]